MEEVSIRDAGPEAIELIRQLAEQTWWPTYSPIISKEQIRYMLDVIYSVQTLEQVMADGSQHFMILYNSTGAQGFASYGVRKDEPGVFKLHKIYVLPENQGKGYGKLLIDEVKRRIQLENSHTLDLNVNRFNAAKSFYEKLGFRVIREEEVPIGPYWMNDYVMRLTL
jgi:ribosomal protein S18 acetylase RimI-like enzyme